ncbi:MAG: AAA family ATPase [Corynebacterium sp.]|nr:AAA family ATPase [Corynebacterium sp.]
MHIDSITLRHVAGVDYLHLDNLPARGVIVVSGPNESGKSTLMTAVQTVLNLDRNTHRRYTSNSKDIRQLVDVTSTERPEITLGATIGGVELIVSKKYTGTKSSTADLRELSPQVRTTHGDAAEDRLGELAGGVDVNLANELFIAQDEATSIVSGVQIRALTRALADEAGSDIDAASDLMELVRTEYETYFQKNGKERAVLTTATKEALEARETVVQLQRRRDELDRLTTHVADLTSQLAAVEAGLGAKQEAVRAAEVAVDQLASLEAAHEQAQQAVDLLREQGTFAEFKVTTRRDLCAEVTAAESAHAAAAAEVEAIEALLAADDARITALTGEIARAEEQLAQAHTAAADAEWALRRARIIVDSQRLTRLGAITAQLTALGRERARVNITKQQVAKLREAHTAVAAARAQRAAAAAKVSFAPAETTIGIDGAEVDLRTGATYDLVAETVLEIGGVTATFTPTASEAMAAREVEKAVAAYERLLDAAGVDSVEEAEARLDTVEEIAAQVAELERQRAGIVAGDSEEDLAAVQEQWGEYDIDASCVEGLDPAEVEAARRLAETTRQAVDTYREQVEAGKDELARLRMSPLRERLASQRALAERAQEEATARRAQLAEAEAENPLDELEAAVVQARRGEEAAQTVLTEAAAALTEAQPQLRHQELEGARQAVERAHRRRGDLQQDIARDLGSLDSDAGLHEEIEKAEVEAVYREEVAATLQRKAAAAKRLWELLRAEQLAAQRVYVQPLEERINGLARYVFGPQFTVEVNENLAISQREESGHRLAIEALSHGTQEQLAVITRIALADIASSSGETDPVPVFFDDLMGHSDPARLQRVCAILAQAGRNHQVFVLTADEDRFAAITGATFVQMADALRETGLGICGAVD